MMAKNHLVVATAVTALAAILVHDVGDIPPIAVGVMVGSLFPDMDTYHFDNIAIHPVDGNSRPADGISPSQTKASFSSSARITHALKPLTMPMSHWLTDVSGGHRKGTHSPIGIVVEAASLYVVARLFPVGAIIISAFLAVLFMRAALPYRNVHGFFRGPIAVGLGIALGYWLHPLFPLLIVSFMAGNFVHVLSDMPCGHIPWGWPLSPYTTNYHVFTVGTPRERTIGGIIEALACVLIVVAIAVHFHQLQALAVDHLHFEALQHLNLHLPSSWLHSLSSWLHLPSRLLHSLP